MKPPARLRTPNPHPPTDPSAAPSHPDNNTAAVDTSTEVCGTKSDFPVMVAPMGLHKAVHPDGELATAAGVVATGSLFVQAVNATTTMEDVRAAPCSPPESCGRTERPFAALGSSTP